jgi:hypothetical protein
MDDRILQEQERDYHRARCDLENFFVKVKVGMASAEDVKEAKQIVNLLIGSDK